jgi:predicted metal-binding protein
MAIKTAKTDWQDVVLVCRKCTKKLKRKGFGPDQDRSLRKALKRWLKPGKGLKATVAVVETGCFDLCPKGAVVAANARAPEKLLVIQPGTDLTEIRDSLGLRDGRRRKRDATGSDAANAS